MKVNRMKRRLAVLLAALMMAVTTASADNDQTRAEALLNGMTLEQKVGQMFMVGLFGPVLTDEGAALLRDIQPGGVVIFAYNVSTPGGLAELVNDWQATSIASGSSPMLVAIDQEGGRINTLEEAPFTQFPVPALITATGNHNLAYQVAAATAAELRAVGVHMNLAPVADLETNTANPVIYRRAYGSDPQSVAPVLSATVQGMQDAGVMATLKHFPGHGDSDVDSHLGLPVLVDNRAALDRLELLPFRAGIQAGAGAVMVGHLAMPELDPTPNLPASLSRPIVTGILREEMGYDGLIMTDALDMDAIDTLYSIPGAAVMAVAAGIDILATGPHLSVNQMIAARDAVVAAVRAGQIPEAQIDASALRILRAKVQYGVLDWQPLDPAAVVPTVEAVNGESLIAPLFDAGVTVVYGQDWLPLDASQTRVAVAYPSHRQTAYNACLAAAPEARFVGFSNFATQTDVDNVAYAASQAEVTVVFTENAIEKPGQAAIVNALEAAQTIVVAYWSPYDLNAFWRRPAGYLTAYSPRDEGIAAACRVLFAAQPARGRLAVNLAPDLPAGMGLGYPAR